MKHYVYKLEDKITKEFYFGSRSCKCNPIDDIYMGSMKTWKPNKNNLIKEIIKSDFETRLLAIDFETKIIADNINKKLNRNFALPGGHFVKLGYITVKDKYNNHSVVHNTDLRYLSGELVHNTTDQVTVRDKNGNTFACHVKDKRYLSGELVGATKGIPMSEEQKIRISKTLQSQMNNMSDFEKKDKFGNQGESNPNYGKRWSDEWKSEQRQRMVEYYKTHPAPRKGATHSDATKQKMSEFRKEYYKTHDAHNLGKSCSDDTKKKIKETLKNQKKITCKYCGITTNRGNINRWHNEKCKSIRKK